MDLRAETCERISSFGLKGEEYDRIINRLLDQILLLRELREDSPAFVKQYTIP